MSFGSTAHYFMELFIFDCSFVRKSLNTPLSIDGVQESASTWENVNMNIWVDEQEREEGKGPETLPSFYLRDTSYFLQSQFFLAPLPY